MSNNHSIKILRGTRITVNKDNFADEEDKLYAGQPIYLTDLNYLAIGTGNDSKVNKLPIIVREVHGYAADNSAIASTQGSSEWRFYASSSTQADIAVTDMDLSISTSGNSKNLLLKSLGGNISVQSNGTLTLQDTATGSNKLGKITITPGDASTSSVILQNGNSKVSIKDGEVAIDSNSGTVFISDSNSTNISRGDTEIVINRDQESGTNRGEIEFYPNGETITVGGNDLPFIKMTTGGMTVGTGGELSNYKHRFGQTKKIDGLIDSAMYAANLSTYVGGASSGTKNVSVSFAPAGTVTVTAGNVPSDSADVIAKQISIAGTPYSIKLATNTSGTDANTIYFVY